MHRARRHRFHQAVLAWVAAWVLALVPTVSRALASAAPAPGDRAAVCFGAPGPGPGDLQHLDHCSHCVLAALPCAAPSPQGFGPLPAPGRACPAPRVRSGALARHWPSAPARAPPRARL